METLSITIFIHGTLLPNVASSLPFIHEFFFCPQGLVKATDIHEKFHLHQIARLLSEQSPREFDINHFYLFGWSGKLRFSSRKQAAEELLRHLLYLKKRAESQSITPLFRLITHSHGGNVALYLKELCEELAIDTLTIDELILLACPVQSATEQYTQACLFKRIYSIHSHKDVFQILDPQGINSFLESLKTNGLEFTLAHLKQLGPVFSSRHFQPKDSLVQLYIHHPYREFAHIEFLLTGFISRLPELLVLMRNHTKASEIVADDMTYIFQGQSF